MKPIGAACGRCAGCGGGGGGASRVDQGVDHHMPACGGGKRGRIPAPSLGPASPRCWSRLLERQRCCALCALGPGSLSSFQEFLFRLPAGVKASGSRHFLSQTAQPREGGRSGGRGKKKRYKDGKDREMCQEKAKENRQRERERKKGVRESERKRVWERERRNGVTKLWWHSSAFHPRE